MERNYLEIFSTNAVWVIIVVVLLGVFINTAQDVQNVIQEQQAQVESQGEIISYGIDVFDNAQAMQPVTLIYWGKVTPTVKTNYTLYLHNGYDLTVSDIAIRTGNVAPANFSNYFQLSWNYTTALIPANTGQYVNMTLYVFENITDIDVFSFSIYLNAQFLPYSV